MITFAKPEMIAGLKEILKKSFGDPDEYIDFFFENRFKPKDTFVYIKDRKPVSMLVLMPASIHLGGQHRTAYYVYGVSTLPEYRSRGLSTALLEYANASKHNIPTFLHPADHGLYKFYQKQGYTTAFYIREVDLNINHTSCIATEFSCSLASAYEYKNLRDIYFEGLGYVNWDIDAIEYAIRENALLGGKAIIVENSKAKHIVLYRTFENKLFIRETSIDDESLLLALINKLMKEERVDKANIRLNYSSQIKIGRVIDFGMIYGADFELDKGYFNLAKD